MNIPYLTVPHLAQRPKRGRPRVRNRAACLKKEKRSTPKIVMAQRLQVYIFCLKTRVGVLTSPVKLVNTPTLI